MTYICRKCGESYTDILCPTVCDCGEFQYNFTYDSSESNTCEWCRMTYPIGEWDYYSATVFGKPHVICADCFDHLKLVCVVNE